MLPFCWSAQFVVYGSSSASISGNGLSHRIFEWSFLVLAAQASFSEGLSSRSSCGGAAAPPPMDSQVVFCNVFYV